MDPDSSTGGLNESGGSDSGNDYNIHDFDSAGSKQSIISEAERTNIDALDDTARDTLIAPLEDSSHSVKSIKRIITTKTTLLHDELDFEGGEDDDDDDGEIDDDDEEGQVNRRMDDEEEEGELEESDDDDEDDDDDKNSGLEDGEVDDGKNKKKIKEKKEDLEEGEVTDDEDRNKEPKPICRFFGKGQCTWGSNCRFLHPGVTDKGLYTMFDPMRPLPVQPVQHFPMKTGLLGHAPPNFAPIIKLEEPIIESAWERGLRHAKEIIKQSVKRKETDVDFEEKKMNLSLGQEEIDKENDYYNRKSSPKDGDDIEQFDDQPQYTIQQPLNNPRDWPPILQTPPPPMPISSNIDPEFIRDRVHHLKTPRGIREAPPRDIPIREAPPLHDSEIRMVRESALRRSRFQEAFHGITSSGGGGATGQQQQQQQQQQRGGRFDDARINKAEEWHDPWMRSPGQRKIRKDSSLSKRSSYSSGSSRSSSHSSILSSKSSSRSNSSQSSKSSDKSAIKTTKNEILRKVAPPRRTSPKPVRIAPPPPPKEEFSRRPYQQQHYERDRITRYAPPQQQQHKSKERQDNKNDDKGTITHRPQQQQQQQLDKSRLKSNNKKNWSDNSSRSSRTRSRSFTPYDDDDSSKSSSHSRSRSVIKRMGRSSKFLRNRSNSINSNDGGGGGGKKWSRSRSISTSSSTTRRSSNSMDKKSLKRKRPMQQSTTKDEPIEKIKKIDEKTTKMINKQQQQSKGQIKLTLKSQTSYKANKTVLDKLADDIDAEDSNSNKDPPSPKHHQIINDDDEEDPLNESRNSKLRRDELLKQLKAVEDAIAKKRSKLI